MLRAAVAVLGAALLLAGCAAAPSGDIESITFHQFQSVPDFDDSDYTQDDPAQLQRFQALLDEFDVVPGSTVTTVEDECAGGLSSTLEIAYSGDQRVDMFIANCGKPEYDEFNSAANDLLTQWREEHSR